MKKNLTIQFLGAAGTVTGSKYLIELIDQKLLIDCGLFQGLKELRLLNWQSLPFDVASLDAVILTHGHLDHVGYLPLLVKQGFKGKIYATEPTIEIAKLILQDSSKIQEEDAERANRFGYSKHHPAKPLYTTKEAESVFPMFQKEAIDQWIKLSDLFTFRFCYNGHILGATFIELKAADKVIVFSGDIGRQEDPLLFSPQKPEQADVLLIESTYGGRTHPTDPETQLAEVIHKAATKQGTIIIPVFAVERAQLLMFYLWKLKNEQRIPDLPIYMDSPMGKHVLQIFANHYAWHKLSPSESKQISQEIQIISKQNETLKLAENKDPKIILAASGMATGGRVLTYFEHFLGDKAATILMVGFQGEGTRGRALLDGAKEIKMRGKYWPVNASCVLVEGLSAHADQNELIDWISKLAKKPEKIFIVHGEPAGSLALKSKLKEVYGYDSIIPELNAAFTIPVNVGEVS
ncbi:MBL fold metallo-hydrolase RNA specificity domain-containing protein [Fluviicola taffensis]|uniref:RNA-metabolising metallo-beta-lactamase n=1 Tax=Fluviicola taffensis (strain DSM 16823 / NCIMB 13979 / RW262) TaxID=755732 RepID=F2I9I7_FLUTR|nr:MBL fold metallo-hydrolase [Fluviicola taffensis]AEA45168.1 RNA-metabolising metallo-beta-lactamase [Fluviicola taffensis DSM 16823]